MNGNINGTASATVTGIVLSSPQGYLATWATLIRVINPGLAGVLIVTLNGEQGGVAWSHVALNVSLTLLSAGQRLRDLFPEYLSSSVNTTADITFVGVLGSPQIEYNFAYI